MKFIPTFFIRLPAIFAVLFLSPTNVHAAPTADQIQQFMQQKNIPIWKSAASKMQNLRQNPPDSEAAAIWKELDAETDDKSGKAPISRATTPKNSKDLLDISSWLKWRILAENADARYSYAYASNVINMRDQGGGFEKEAAVYFFLARLSLSIDGARCVDQASPGNISMQYELRMQPLLERLNQLSKQEKAVAILEAVSIEQMRGERPPKGYLCVSGARTALRALALGRKTEPANLSLTEQSRQLGSPQTIDTSGLEPELISNDIWMQKRREILERYLKDAIADL